MKINPLKITKFNRSERELQFFWIYSILVAGKDADQTARKVSKLFKDLGPRELPFDHLVTRLTDLHNILVANRIGQYGRIELAIHQSLKLKLKTVTAFELESIHGVGPKTARLFLLHSRKDQNYAVLDTHILQWMRDHGVDAPKDSPPKGKRYDELERLFISLAKAHYPDLTLPEIDILIWAKQSGRLNE